MFLKAVLDLDPDTEYPAKADPNPDRKYILKNSFLLVLALFRIQIQSGQWIRIRIPNPDPDPGGQQ
jgi:hypothetical protein